MLRVPLLGKLQRDKLRPQGWDARPRHPCWWALSRACLEVSTSCAGRSSKDITKKGMQKTQLGSSTGAAGCKEGPSELHFVLVVLEMSPAALAEQGWELAEGRA